MEKTKVHTQKNTFNSSNNLNGDRPHISIIMPALNEEKYIVNAIKSLLTEGDKFEIELLVMDGGSIDKTLTLVNDMSTRDSRIKIINNSKKIQSAGVNKGAINTDARSKILVRADCHAVYPNNFLSGILRPFANPKIVAVVVPMQTAGITCFQRAVSAAQNSWFGNGGSAHRKQGESRFVDHGHHAAIRKDIFLQLNGYDETFTHNEDAEFDIRINQANKLIWLSADIPLIYFPRSDPISLAKQYFRHGKGRAKTIIKHNRLPKIRQLAPLIVTTINLASIIGLPFSDGISGIIPLIYIVACLTIGCIEGFKQGDFCALISGVTAIIMHSSWAFGFIYQTISQIIPKGADQS